MAFMLPNCLGVGLTGLTMVELGRIWWKGAIVPGMMTGAAVMEYTADQVKKMQTVENSVYRQLLGGSCIYGYPANAGVRGEIGSSTVKARMIQTRLIFVKGIMEGENDMLKVTLESMREGGP